MGYDMKNNIKKYLEKNILIADGAMGTFFKTLKPESEYPCELGCLYDEYLIENIHKKYIEAGAKLIRTNTFGANASNLDSFETAEKVIKKAVEIAERAAQGKDVFIGASIGPIADAGSDMRKYFEIIDAFIKFGIEIFVFETFNNYKRLIKAAAYIKNKNPNAFVLTQFALTDTAVTKKSVSAKNIIKKMTADNNIDAVGFNCGIGPMHMLNIIKKLENMPKIMTAMPNAGYPEVIDGRIEYIMNPKYFAKMVCDISDLGVKIVGGCCGTTPEHIKLLSDMISSVHKIEISEKSSEEHEKKVVTDSVKAVKNKFHERNEKNRFLIAVELDPPFKTDTKKILEAAAYLKQKNVDIITIADSPMGKTRADSIVISSKILRETGIDVLPHICCRDRNSISLRSAVLGAYIEGIRNFLIVTGDPVPSAERLETKSVFDLNSYSLTSMINEMNESVFEQERVKIGCAVNFNVKNKDSELKRLIKKRECGAEFFLTQPIFSDDVIEYLSRMDKNRNYKILGGIMPLVSYKNAQFINNELPGITVSQKYIDKFSPDMTRQEAQKVGIEIAVDIGEKIKPYVDGFYITTPFNRYDMVAQIIDRLNL